MPPTPAFAGRFCFEAVEEDAVARASSSRCNEPSPESSGFAVEATEIGLQSLIPDVTPITPIDRLALRAAAPMRPTKLQRPCDFGLFDFAARDQLDLFSKLPPTGG
jgi:hypothetical protein